MAVAVPTSGLKEYVRSLAVAHGIMLTRTYGDVWAEAVTRLAGDDIATDEVEDMIVALRRSHAITAEMMVALLGNYLDEE